MGEGPTEDELAQVLDRGSGALPSDGTVEAALHLVTTVAEHTIEGADGVSITARGPDHRLVTIDASDASAVRADDLQHRMGEGPCLAASTDRALVRSDDLLHESRWPRWARAVQGIGCRSCLCAPLVAGDRCVGALTVYSRRAAALTERDEQMMGIFAAQAAFLVSNLDAHRRSGRLGDELRTALHRRDVVNQAKGFVMGRDGTTESAALAHLVGLARSEHRTVIEVASCLVGSAARPR
ncbi:GAF and ANTAR domain-containing protein [Actinotalea sp. K2]|uniref:GAF and ANTAR domain-containing protein n=1 Tax=Actinotalea sp. K2 TaxID=2939438 RepID=UPI002016FAC9|nr:GAF and ANTAR domain-containing protein [Actinotalea sp. K2]MCL3862386.1 GAF and ANTAR domain-containing protein [Actinotalea sp. K2]